MLVKILAGTHAGKGKGELFEFPDGHPLPARYPQRFEIVQLTTGVDKAPPPSADEVKPEPAVAKPARRKDK